MPRGLELTLQRLAVGLGAFEHGVRIADRVGEHFVGEIVESITMQGSLIHGSSPWFGSGPGWCANAFGGRYISM
jgi:hypothetical protein